jgi:DNA-binding LacI/PurR family transcriptional regulator
MSKITIQTIANESGFSETTVSRALNGHPAVKDETKNLIFDVSRRLGYKPGLSAGSFPHLSGFNMIGILMPDMTNPYFTGIVSCSIEELENRGYQAVVLTLSRNEKAERACFQIFLQSEIRGLIVVARYSRTVEYMKTLVSSRIPMVLAASLTDDPAIRCVSIDHERAMYNGAEYLITLGHRKIYYIGSDASIIANHKRLDGFLAAVKANNLPLQDCKTFNAPVNRAGGYSATMEIIASRDLPTAIIAANDNVAFGVMEACQEKGIKIPEDVSLLGFDNIETSSYPSIGLTTIRQPCRELSDAAVDMLLNQIEHKDRIDRKHVIMESSLIIRNTCCRVPGNSNFRS